MDELLTRYRRASEWTAEKVSGAAGELDAPTPDDEWDVRALLNHMIDTQQYFAGTARGEEVSPPSPHPPSLIGVDPADDFERARQEVLDAYSAPGVTEQRGGSLGIAFSDVLVHGWDVARATNQDTAMPDGLAQAAYDTLDGRLTDETRGSAFKPAIAVADDASPQAKLLAYTGREPDDPRPAS
jgi:uncharacterized protein (TIGR03086 family)